MQSAFSIKIPDFLTETTHKIHIETQKILKNQANFK